MHGPPTFTFLCGISHTLSTPAVFIYLSTRAKCLSRGFFLACRLGSTSKRTVFVRQPKCDYSYRVLFFAKFDLFLRFGGSSRTELSAISYLNDVTLQLLRSAKNFCAQFATVGRKFYT